MEGEGGERSGDRVIARDLVIGKSKSTAEARGEKNKTFETQRKGGRRVGLVRLQIVVPSGTYSALPWPRALSSSRHLASWSRTSEA